MAARLVGLAPVADQNADFIEKGFAPFCTSLILLILAFLLCGYAAMSIKNAVCLSGLRANSGTLPQAITTCLWCQRWIFASWPVFRILVGS